MATGDWFVDTFRALLPGRPLPAVFVETGTFMGGNVPGKIGNFREIHSIDLKESYVTAARERYPDPSVTFHHGDSGHVLDALVDTWEEPVLFFLDAHWSGGETARAVDTETPLLKEMEVLSRRTSHADVIFVDDTRFLGKKMFGGTPGCSVWPYTEFDWREVTLEALLKAYKRECRIITCTDVADRIILVPV